MGQDVGDRAVTDIRQVNDEARLIAEWIDNSVADAGEYGYVLLRRLHEHIERHPAFEPTAAAHREVDPMTDVQAQAFARQAMPFGYKKGKPVGEIDLHYLCCLVDPSPFIEELRRYLKSPAVRREIEENES